MFDLMEAIRQRQKVQPPPVADSAETAESPQPQAGELAEGLRKDADKDQGEEFSATTRKYPQTPKISKAPETKGSREFSANPQYPQTDTDKNRHRAEIAPRQALAELAKELRATPHMLRRLLSADDMQAITEGEYTRELLVDYFRLMEKDGHALTDLDHTIRKMESKDAKRRRQSAHSRAEWNKAWKAATSCS